MTRNILGHNSSDGFVTRPEQAVPLRPVLPRQPVNRTNLVSIIKCICVGATVLAALNTVTEAPWRCFTCSAEQRGLYVVTPFRVVQSRPFRYQQKAHIRLSISE